MLLFKFFSYLLPLISFGALVSTGELNLAYALLGLIALGVSPLYYRFDRPPPVWPFTTATIFFALLVSFEALFLASSVILPLAHFLIYLMANKLFNLKEDRDYYELYAISFFQLLIASVLTIHFSFALFFLAYQVAAIFALVLFHFKREASALGPQALKVVLDRPFFLTLSGSIFLTLLLTLGIFLIVPRLGVALLQLKLASPLLLSGYSDRVELGDFGDVLKDPAVAMRIKPSGLSDGKFLSARIRWRGATYDRYDGRAWHRTMKDLRPVPRTPYGLYTLEGYPAPSERGQDKRL